MSPKWMPSGLFYGLTTNPLLLQRADVACDLDTLTTLAYTGFDLGAQEIHLQVWGTTVDVMLAVGRQLAAIDARVAVKVPITREGCVCAQQLIAEGSRVTLTGVYAAYQIVTAMVLGANYAAPYLGRMNEADRDGGVRLEESPGGGTAPSGLDPHGVPVRDAAHRLGDAVAGDAVRAPSQGVRGAAGDPDHGGAGGGGGGPRATGTRHADSV